MSYSVPVEPGKKVRLAAIDPAADGGLSKADGVQRTAELTTRLADLQQELYAASVHSLLVVLQGMDANGMIGVFNRSHYEDVLIVRVHELVPRKVWKQRYQQINDFERLLVDSGTIVCKFFLHISKEEQRQRLLAREQDVEKAYKLSPDDWKERDRWEDYAVAYEEALHRCSTPEAPWTIVPADRKWYRDLAIAEALVDRLEGRRRVWQARLRKLSEQRLAELAEFHAAEQPASPDGQKGKAVVPQ